MKRKMSMKKRNNITIGEKQAIIARLESGEKNSQIAKDLNVNHTTISGIWRAREAIRNAKESPGKSRLMNRYQEEDEQDQVPDSEDSPEMSVKLEDSENVENSLNSSQCSVSNLCRLCLTSTDNMLEIFGKVGVLTNISEIISKLFNLKIVQNDRWPQSICIPCFEKLMDYHAFYSTVKISEKSLIGLFGELDPSVDEDLVPQTNENLAEDDSTKTDVLPDYQCKQEPCQETQQSETYELFFEMEDNKEETYIEDDLEKKQHAKKPRTIQKSNAGPTKRKLSADVNIAKFINLICEECSKTFATFEDLTKHYNVEHNQEGYVKCCNLTIKTRLSLLEHVRLHKDPKTYTCNDCGRTYLTHRSLNQHRYTHVPEEERKFKCDKCPRAYMQWHRLNNHQLIHRPRDQWEHFCPQCQKVFPTVHLMRAHVKLKHERSQEKVCEICAKVIGDNYTFRLHQRVHMNLPRLECDFCKKTFKDKYTIVKHMRLHKPAIGVFPCEICGKEFPRKERLKYHRNNAHKGKEFKCNLCEKKFKYAINLKEHVATHSGQQYLYSCSFCNKMFNSNANKYSHQKKMHPREWEKQRKTDNKNK